MPLADAFTSKRLKAEAIEMMSILVLDKESGLNVPNHLGHSIEVNPFWPA